ncbi:MAG: VanW family protein [Oscillospiraceae bacterium]
MVYQENKVHNLKLAARQLDGLLIEPGETFSFWNRVRYADRETPYRDALTEQNGRLTTVYGGGLCQITNLLCWVFLHTPVTFVERHGHSKKDFPEPPSDAPLGVDATVAEGWMDFKVRNDTDTCLQLSVTFSEAEIIGAVYAARDLGPGCRVVNRSLVYRQVGDQLLEEVDIVACPTVQARPRPSITTAARSTIPSRPVRRSDLKQKRSLDHEREENDCRRLWRLFPGI